MTKNRLNWKSAKIKMSEHLTKDLSSNLKEFGYDFLTKTLRVKFRDKDSTNTDYVYRYSPVEEEDYQLLKEMADENNNNIGETFYKKIRNSFTKYGTNYTRET